MAEIDRPNPMPPVWPSRPVHQTEEGEKAKDEARRQQQRKKKRSRREDDDDDSSPHIDEYA